MTTNTAPVPPWGLAHVVPDNALAAWGARLIVTQDGGVDFLWDRQGSDEGEHSRDLLNMLDKRLNVIELRKIIGDLLVSYDMQTRQAEDFILYLDDRLVIHANTNASAGYCYVTAWMTP